MAFNEGDDSGDEVDFSPQSNASEGPISGVGESSGDFVTDPDEDIALPSSFKGGLDMLRSRSERQAFKYRQAALTDPVYNVNGQLTRDRPQRSFIPMGQPDYQREDEQSFIPVQEQMARQAEASIPRLPDGSPLTDEHVFANRSQIYQQLLQGSGGKLTSDSFVNNPFWDQFKGLDNDGMASFKKSVLSNIYPIYKYHRAVDGLKQEFQSTLQDEDNPWGGKLLSSLRPEEQQQIHDVLSGKSTNIKFAQGVLRTIQEKKEILGDPDNDKLMQDLGDPNASTEDKLRYKHLMDTHSGSAFATGLAQIARQVQKRQDLRDKTIENSDAWLAKNVQEGSPIRDYLSGKMQELSDAGVFDKNPGLANKILEISKTKTGEFDLGEDREGNNLGKIFGLKTVVEEGKLREQLEEKIKNGGDPSQIYIDSDYKIHDGIKGIEYSKRALKDQFGDLSLHGKSEWISLPKGKLQDSAGNDVVLSDGTEHEVSPIAFGFQDTVVMRRDELKKLGITTDELKDDAPIIVPSKFNALLAKEAKPYTPPVVTAENFLKDTDSEGKPMFDGQRFAAYHPNIDAIRENMDKANQSLTKHFFNLPPVDDPTYAKEVTKGLFKGVTNSLLTAAYFTPAVINTTKNALVGSIYEMMGDDKTANEYYNKGLGSNTNELSSVGLDQQVDEATKGDFLDLGKLNMSENATDGQKIAHTIADGVGGIVGMGVQIGLMGPAGTEGAAMKIAGLGSKMMQYGKQLEELQAMTGNAERIMDITKVQQRFFGTAKSILDMSLLGIIQGHTTPGQMAESAALGGLQSIPQVFGRGAAIPFFGKPSETIVKEIEGAYRAASGSSPLTHSFYETGTKELSGGFRLPDWTRVGAAAVAIGGMGSIDYYRKKFEGMTPDQILQTYKDPTELANFGINIALPLLGSHEYKSMSGERTMQGPNDLVTVNNQVSVGKNLGIRLAPIKTVEMQQDIHTANTKEYLELAAKGESRTKEENAKMSELVQVLAPPTHSSTKFDQISYMDGLAKKINDPAISPEERASATAEFHSLYDTLMHPKSSVEDPIVNAKDQGDWDQVLGMVKTGKGMETGFENMDIRELAREAARAHAMEDPRKLSDILSEAKKRFDVEGLSDQERFNLLNKGYGGEIPSYAKITGKDVGTKSEIFWNDFKAHLEAPRSELVPEHGMNKWVPMDDIKEAARIVKSLQETYKNLGKSNMSQIFQDLESKAALNTRMNDVADLIKKGDKPNEVIASFKQEGIPENEAQNFVASHFHQEAFELAKDGKTPEQIESQLSKSGLEEAGLDPKEISANAFEEYNLKAGEVQATEIENLEKQSQDQGCVL